MNDRRLKLLGLSLAGILVAAGLPIEQSLVGWYNPLFVLIKMTIAVAALLVPVAGLGALLVDPLARWRRTGANGVEHALGASASLLLGVVLAGLVTFLLGQAIRPGPTLGFTVLGLAYAASWHSYRPNGFLTESIMGAREGWRTVRPTWTRFEQVAWGIVAVATLVKLVPAFMYQQHGDPYSYTVSATDRWLRLGRTGLDLRDIHTGYALGCEHFYLFLKLILGGHTEQYVGGTLFSVIAGFGTFVTGMLALARRFAPRAALPLVAAFALQSPFTYIAWQPRNDATLAGFALLAVAGLALELEGLFLAAAAGVFIVKAPGAITFVALGLTTFVLGKKFLAPSRLKRTFTTLAGGAALMVLVWCPFAVYNYLTTGNPLFPLANELFRSPFAPTQFGDVIDDMAPFTVTLLGSLRGLGRMLGTHPVYVLGILTLVATPFLARGRRPAVAAWLKDPAFAVVVVFVVIDAYLVQLATREYTPDFASRHVLAVFGPLVVLALAAITWVVSGTRAERVVMPLLLLLCLADSRLEVSVQEIFRFVTTPNQTASIQERQPILKLTAFLDRYVREHDLKDQRVVSVANNLSYFLTAAEFWHETKTYPMWSWPIGKMTTEEWGKAFTAHQVGFVITGPQEPEIGRRIALLPHELLLEAETYRLLRLP